MINQPLLPLSSAGSSPLTNNTPVSTVNKTLAYLNKNTSVSSNTSISSSNTNEPTQSLHSNHVVNHSQHSYNNNYVNYNLNSEINDTIKQHADQEDVNIRNNLSNNLDDITLSFQTNTSLNKTKQPITTKVTNTVHDIGNDFDFDHFTKGLTIFIFKLLILNK